MRDRPARKARQDDGLELLTRLSVHPACMVRLMLELGFDGCRFKTAVESIRERGIRLLTDGDAETIRVLRASYADAVSLANWYVERNG